MLVGDRDGGGVVVFHRLHRTFSTPEYYLHLHHQLHHWLQRMPMAKRPVP
jgi:hypothetical protein